MLRKLSPILPLFGIVTMMSLMSVALAAVLFLSLQ